MKEKIFLGVIVVSFVMLAETAFATPIWDLTGTYTIVFHCTSGCSGDWPHSMTINVMDLGTGGFSGNGNYIPDPGYTWDVTGTVSDSSVEFSILYTGKNAGYYVDLIGTIASDGTMSGTATSSSGQTFTWETTTGAATFVRTAEITAPLEDEEVSGGVDFEAYLIDDDEDGVQWAVRKGTCAAGTNTVFGNVDGFNNPYNWDYNAETYTHSFSATADTCEWEPGEYCFVFNPTEDNGEANIRLTREFTVLSCDEDGDGIDDDEDLCPETVTDVPEKLGTNRWIWDGQAWKTKEPNGVGPQKEFTMEDTRGCSCFQILETMDGKMSGHSKFGCSISVMEDFIAGLPPLLVETVQVDANDPNPTYSNIALESGVQYELEAMGTAYAGGKYTEDIEFDAKYSITHSKIGDTWTDVVTDYESYGTTLLDLFVNGGSVDWGAYNPEHIYYWTVTGTDTPVELLIYDIYYPNNVGSLTVNIYELP